MSATEPAPNDEARRNSKLIARLPGWVELEKDRNKAKSRRKAQPLRFKLVTIGDLIAAGGPLWQLAAAGAPSLSETRDLAASQAHAGAGGSAASDLQQVRRQQQRYLQPDIGQA